ncbi:hypothetical protein CU044_2961 [Streptomyces sp. L-9-10]|nr:hypothetical protein CU044_2961 [Streptomyces sp. L-9-10]
MVPLDHRPGRVNCGPRPYREETVAVRLHDAGYGHPAQTRPPPPPDPPLGHPLVPRPTVRTARPIGVHKLSLIV